MRVIRAPLLFLLVLPVVAHSISAIASSPTVNSDSRAEPDDDSLRTAVDVLEIPSLGSLRCGSVGTNTRQCLGVPFAAPPTGALRWRAPANVSSWDGVRDATKRAPLCIQGGHPPVANETDEDCLYLDIYTPKRQSPTGGYPVIIWLHGGSYSTGSPQNASMLVELTQDVVWVGVNYR